MTRIRTPQFRTGNGEWTYEVVHDWGTLPAGKTFGETHGGISSDRAGNIYVSTQSETGVLVYRRGRKAVKTIANEYPEVHSLQHALRRRRGIFLRHRTKGHTERELAIRQDEGRWDGRTKDHCSPEAGFHAPNEWRLTAAVPGPDGSIYIANGYGDSRLFRFDAHGNYQESFSGKGKEDGQCDCSHGLAVDTRYDQPLLLVCDRENLRLSHYDFDGKFVRNITLHLRRPCQVSFMGEYAVVSELLGRVTVLDKDNVPVAFLGDNPQKSQWANYDVNPESIGPSDFSAAHGCHIDKDANIYISDWNKFGRVIKLARVKNT